MRKYEVCFEEFQSVMSLKNRRSMEYTVCAICNSIVAIVTDPWHHLTYDSRGVWHTVTDRARNFHLSTHIYEYFVGKDE